MIYNIDDCFPNYGNWKYKGETVREILHKDSGYIKDLIMKSDSFSLSDICMKEALEITKGNMSVDEKYTMPNTVFDGLKIYASRSPYDFDLNTQEIQDKNIKNRH